MKSFSILSAFAFAMMVTTHVCAQDEITLVHEYESEVFVGNDAFIYIAHDNPKYFIRDDDGFQLYNMDFTLFKSIEYPEAPDAVAWTVDMISLSLFDCDESQLEYLAYSSGSIEGNQLRVWREDGTALLELDGYSIGSFLTSPKINPLYRAASDSTGTYLRVASEEGFGVTSTVRIYKLCGQMPMPLARESGGNVLGGRPAAVPQGNMQLYPNPGQNELRIDYDLKGHPQGTLEIFNQSGQIVHEAKLGPVFDHVRLNLPQLPAGMYVVRIHSEDGWQLSEKWVKVGE